MYAIRSYYEWLAGAHQRELRPCRGPLQQVLGGLQRRRENHRVGVAVAEPARITSYNVCYTKLLRFLAAFREKEPHRDLLARVPVRVVVDPELALKGAARLAADSLGA